MTYACFHKARETTVYLLVEGGWCRVGIIDPVNRAILVLPFGGENEHDAIHHTIGFLHSKPRIAVPIVFYSKKQIDKDALPQPIKEIIHEYFADIEDQILFKKMKRFFIPKYLKILAKITNAAAQPRLINY